MSYFVANWKLNGSAQLVTQLAEAMPSEASFSHIITCPPLPYLNAVKAQYAHKTLGGQDCSPHSSGAHTGEVSADMLKEAGCEYVILGHSERREQHHESNLLVREKSKAAIQAGLTPIICIGESLAEREGGDVLAILETQLRESLPDTATAENTLIAYEPIWAIGTGHVATLDQIEDVHSHLKSLSNNTPLLYGGSVKANNIREICAVQGVDGVLVGSASIDPQQCAQMLAL